MNGHHSSTGEKLRDFILGIQDGIVNVLGLVLGVASATYETKAVLIAGIAGLFAESISMGAVAYTSSKAARDFYKKNKERKEANLYRNPIGIAFFVFFATILGSVVPVLPFFFIPVKIGILLSVALSGVTLFVVGAVKGNLTNGKWTKSGIEMLLVGLLSAIIGYFIGILLGIVIN